jgi:hypothetical protein
MRVVLNPIPYLLVDLQPDAPADYDPNSFPSLSLHNSTTRANGTDFLQSYGLGSPAKALCLSFFRRAATSCG